MRRAMDSKETTDAQRVAKEQIKSFFEGKAYEIATPEFQKAVDVAKRDLTQAVVDDLLVRSGRMKTGDRLYGTYAKTADGNFRNVRTGEVFDAVAMATMSQRFSTRKIERSMRTAAENNVADTRYVTKAEGVMSPQTIANAVDDMVRNGLPTKLTPEQFSSLQVALK